MRNAIALAAVLSTAGLAHGAVGFSLDFNGSGNTLAATGFSNVYNLNPTGFSVGGGVLTTHTLDGDTFGDYDNDPDTAQNTFYNPIDFGASTVSLAKVTVSTLNSNFHGGGIWIGTDEDHYARLGVFHNTFVAGGPVSIELLRENEDRWTGRDPGNPGDDIVSNATGIAADSAQPLTVLLRLTRTGNNVVGEYSLDNGGTFLPAGSFGGFALPGNSTGVSNTEEGGLKAGIYAVGGGNPQGTYAFDSLVVTPEPTSLALLGMGGLLLRRRR